MVQMENNSLIVHDHYQNIVGVTFGFSLKDKSVYFIMIVIHPLATQQSNI